MAGAKGLDAIVRDARRLDQTAVDAVAEPVPVGLICPGIREVNLVQIDRTAETVRRPLRRLKDITWLCAPREGCKFGGNLDLVAVGIAIFVMVVL